MGRERGGAPDRHDRGARSTFSTDTIEISSRLEAIGSLASYALLGLVDADEVLLAVALLAAAAKRHLQVAA